MIGFVATYIYFYAKEEIYARFFAKEGYTQKIITSAVLTIITSLMLFLAQKDVEQILNIRSRNGLVETAPYWLILILADITSTIFFIFALKSKNIDISRLYVIFDIARLGWLYLFFIAFSMLRTNF